MIKKGFIVLEDGTAFQGQSFGFHGEQTGEIVFNTGMTGYQEILTDPSYRGQIVVMTYPLIGNYGINSIDQESERPQVSGFIVKENSPVPSNWRSRESLSDYLMRHQIIGLEGVDTRAITRHIRLRGAMKALISTEADDISSLLARVQAAPGIVGKDLVQEVSTKEPYTYGENLSGNDPVYWYEYLPDISKDTYKAESYLVVAMDFGVKRSILRQLNSTGCKVRVVPAHTSAEEILSLKPQGLFLSNGPGDPAAVPYAVDTVKKLLGTLPIFGICLGHQIVGLALGGKTFKLKFGHRGCNHPVKDLTTGRVEITSQNHGFCVDLDSLKSQDITITHLNLNDQTLEGMQHNTWPLFSVQYHPEASPGPHDSHYLFQRFYEMIRLHENRRHVPSM
ncbi:MAG: glutamine-hydrolyzing carbamoyl-phosphate synthase small subunit [bacterium]